MLYTNIDCIIMQYRIYAKGETLRYVLVRQLSVLRGSIHASGSTEQSQIYDESSKEKKALGVNCAVCHGLALISPRCA